MVHDVRGIHAKLQVTRLVDTNPLEEIHVEIPAAWPLDDVSSKRSDLSRTRIDEDEIAIGIRDRQVREGASNVRCEAAESGVSYLLQIREVDDTIRNLGDFAGILHSTDKHRCAVGRVLPDCGYRRRHR